jgi:hypothetical protein
MIELVSIAFGQPRLISEQIRLLGAYLLDAFSLTVLDNSNDEGTAQQIRAVCEEGLTAYERIQTPDHMHHHALNLAAARFRERGSELYGFLDHDIFPVRPTRLVPYVEEVGFFGIGQRTPASGNLYLWPGFCFFSRAWIGDRMLDFGGADGGDTGSAMWPLFAESDWQHFYRVGHGYQAIRHPDSVGLQSWGYELIGDFAHLTNGSRWMIVPDQEERERLLYEMLAAL